MTPKEFVPPKPAGDPYRGDPKDSVPFLTEGAPLIPPGSDEMTTPWMNDSAFPGTPSGQPQFRPAPKIPLSPEEVQTLRIAKVGLGSGIASIFFFWPLFGPIAVGLGIAAIRRGERKIGTWAVSTGAAGILIGLIVTVLVLTNVVDADQLEENLKNLFSDMKTQK